MEFVNKYCDIIDKHTKDCKCLTDLEEKVKFRRCYIVLVAVAVLLLIFSFAFGLPFLANIIGFIFPTYFSMKALATDNKVDDKKWLIYWVVYGCFTVIETFLSVFAKVNWFYYIVKIVFLVCCFIPEVDLSTMVYVKYVEPFLSKHEKTIDDKMKKVAEKVAEKVEEVVVEKAKEIAEKAKEEVAEKAKEEVTEKVAEKVEEAVSEVVGQIEEVIEETPVLTKPTSGPRRHVASAE